MKCFVTGCAGFIGSHLTAKLLDENHEVVGYDNLSTGKINFIENQFRHPGFQFIHGDLLDTDKLNQGIQGADVVFHLAANADVRFGTDHPHKDLQQNTIATFHVLEAMRLNNVKKIVFSSTGSVYGEAAIIPTPENAPFPVQTSLYGASKLACEGLIQAYAEGFDMQAYIFRFVSILGEHYTHGHVVDFYNQLIKNPDSLQVLGNGLQRKSYLHVSDCIDGILLASSRVVQKVNIFNLGTDSYCSSMIQFSGF